MKFAQMSMGFRIRAAGVLVVLYALCVLAPAAAFAFGDNAKAAHYLTDENNGLAHVHSTTHAHDDGTAHQHADDSDEQQSGATGSCCGLFCLSALAPYADLPSVQPELLALVRSLDATGIIGQAPDRLYRPPDALLSH